RSTWASLLSQYQIQRPAAQRMRAVLAEVVQQRAVGAAGLLQRVAQDRQAAVVAVGDDALCQLRDQAALPRHPLVGEQQVRRSALRRQGGDAVDEPRPDAADLAERIAEQLANEVAVAAQRRQFRVTQAQDRTQMQQRLAVLAAPPRAKQGQDQVV